MRWVKSSTARTIVYFKLQHTSNIVSENLEVANADERLLLHVSVEKRMVGIIAAFSPQLYKLFYQDELAR